MRILLVSQMYPSAEAPDFGAFVAQVERALLAQGHEIERAVIDRRGGPRTKYLELGLDAVRAARSFRPDVVYAHFLIPAGGVAALASLASGAALVLTAHGQDVRNIEEIPGFREATKLAARRARAVICVSDYLRTELVAALPEVESKTSVVDCGVDLERFRGGDPAAAREELGWAGPGPFYLFVGTLDERKNPVRLARAFERLEAGQLAFVGDGPLRPELEGRERVRLAGRVAHEEVARWITACDVLCQPSTIEPFGQAILEALACERSVVATRVGGPPEFVEPGCGVLVEPLSVDAIEAGLREKHDVRVQARRIAEILTRAAG